MLLLAVLLVAAPAGGWAQSGTSGAQFLKISPHARPSGMGEAFSAVADDVNAVYYNPAGLGALKNVQVSGSHTALYQGVSYEYAALSVPLLSWTKDQRPKNAYGTLGVSIYNLSVRGIERRGTTETDSPIETFGASDFAYALSYGYAIPETSLSLGLTGKHIDQQIDTVKASAYALDLGSLYRRGDAAYAFGVRNAGTKVKFSTQADPLPMTVYLGGSYRFNERWLGSAELDKPRDRGVQLAFGTEYKKEFGQKLAGSGRLGYAMRNNDAGGFSGLSFGLGLGYNNFNFDFALVPFGDLGNAYKYSMLVKF
jgi:long-subunit fatty acid transport protein